MAACVLDHSGAYTAAVHGQGLDLPAVAVTALPVCVQANGG